MPYDATELVRTIPIREDGQRRGVQNPEGAEWQTESCALLSNSISFLCERTVRAVSQCGFEQR